MKRTMIYVFMIARLVLNATAVFSLDVDIDMLDINGGYGNIFNGSSAPHTYGCAENQNQAQMKYLTFAKQSSRGEDRPGFLLRKERYEGPGDYKLSLFFDRRVRNYFVHIPPSYTVEKPVPVVIVLHGGGSNATQAADSTRFNSKADEEGFIVVYPNGTGKLKDRYLTWNAGNCCGYALENNVDDVGFIRVLIEKLKKGYAVDSNRIYVTGISNGGMMTYKLACELSDEIAAIAPVAGALNIEEPRPTTPVSVIIFHGTADERVLYTGGRPKKNWEKRERIDNSVSYAVDFWVKHNGCEPVPTREEIGNIICETYSGGRGGTEVKVYTIKGGNHSWPGGLKTGRLGDEPTNEISATAVMWDFFSEHPKR